MNLVQQAQTNSLPLFQYMDAATLHWIGQNSSQLDSATLPDNLTATFAEFLFVDPAWYAEKRLINSLHGERHLLRVGYFSGLLAQHINCMKHERRLAMVAGLLHDVGRQNDKQDSGHAMRSATWFNDHIDQVSRTWNTEFSATEKQKIYVAIALHETPYESFTGEQKQLYGAHKTLVDIVKAADALDRYRLPKLKWWPNPAHIAFDIPGSLYAFASRIVLTSEQIAQSGVDNRQAVMDAAYEVTHGL